MSHEDSDDNAEDNDAIHEATEEEEEIVFHLSTGNVLSGQSTEQPNTNQQDYASQHRSFHCNEGTWNSGYCGWLVGKT